MRTPLLSQQRHKLISAGLMTLIQRVTGDNSQAATSSLFQRRRSTAIDSARHMQAAAPFPCGECRGGSPSPHPFVAGRTSRPTRPSFKTAGQRPFPSCPRPQSPGDRRCESQTPAQLLGCRFCCLLPTLNQAWHWE